MKTIFRTITIGFAIVAFGVTVAGATAHIVANKTMVKEVSEAESTLPSFVTKAVFDGNSGLQRTDLTDAAEKSVHAVVHIKSTQNSKTRTVRRVPDIYDFFFGDGMYVITFDLERVKWTDRIFDVGRIVGELQHFFLRSTGDKNNAEPFIQYFLQEYAWHFPDQPETFQSITARIPFHMGTTLLRIARNSYLDQDYRMQLVSAAKECLRRK